MNVPAQDTAQVPMTEALAATLASASAGARAMGHGVVTLEHLLMALCEDPDAVAVLGSSQISIAQVQADTNGYLSGFRSSPPQGGSAGGGANLRVSPDFSRILEAAGAAARGGKRREIDGAIVLAAIIGDGQSVAAQILQHQGLTFDETIRALQKALQQPRFRPTPNVVPHADDILASARQRVQSRSTPGFRELMGHAPASAPRPPLPPSAPRPSLGPMEPTPLRPSRAKAVDDMASRMAAPPPSAETFPEATPEVMDDGRDDDQQSIDSAAETDFELVDDATELTPESVDALSADEVANDIAGVVPGPDQDPDSDYSGVATDANDDAIFGPDLGASMAADDTNSEAQSGDDVALEAEPATEQAIVRRSLADELADHNDATVEAARVEAAPVEPAEPAIEDNAPASILSDETDDTASAQDVGEAVDQAAETDEETGEITDVAVSNDSAEPEQMAEPATELQADTEPDAKAAQETAQPVPEKPRAGFAAKAESPVRQSAVGASRLQPLPEQPPKSQRPPTAPPHWPDAPAAPQARTATPPVATPQTSSQQAPLWPHSELQSDDVPSHIPGLPPTESRRPTSMPPPLPSANQARPPQSAPGQAPSSADVRPPAQPPRQSDDDILASIRARTGMDAPPRGATATPPLPPAAPPRSGSQSGAPPVPRPIREHDARPAFADGNSPSNLGPLGEKLARSAQRTSSAARKAPTFDAGQLAENVPRTMRVATTERIEVRVAKAEVRNLTSGLEGGSGASLHDIAVTSAMSLRLRAPDGGFFIEMASPETQWVESQLRDTGDDYASWRFLVTPKERGRRRLQIIVSARTAGPDGVIAETALPDQVVEIKVRANMKRTVVRAAGWTMAAIIGGALARFGEQGYGLIDMLAKRFAG